MKCISIGPRLVKIKNLRSDSSPTFGFVKRSPNLIPFLTDGSFLDSFFIVELFSFYSNTFNSSTNIPIFENTCNSIRNTKTLEEIGFLTDN